MTSLNFDPTRDGSEGPRARKLYPGERTMNPKVVQITGEWHPTGTPEIHVYKSGQNRWTFHCWDLPPDVEKEVKQKVVEGSHEEAVNYAKGVIDSLQN